MAYEPGNDGELAVRNTLESFQLGLTCGRLDSPNAFPDYEVSQLQTPLFLLEVKELRCIKDTDGTDDVDEYLKPVGWTFDDLTRVLKRHLEKARKQFLNAVAENPKWRDLPRILWFRTELAVHIHDFERAVKGVFNHDGVPQESNPAVRADAEVQLPLTEIDAFVWQPVNGGMTQGFRQSDRSAQHRRALTFELIKMLNMPMQTTLHALRESKSLPLWEERPRKLFGGPLW